MISKQVAGRCEKCCVLIFALLYSGLSQTCPIENSQAINGSSIIEWIPNQSQQNYLTFSNPPCLDEDDKLIVRKCLNGTWHPKTPNPCVSIISNNTKCPNYFIESDVCTLLTEPTHWNDRCKLTNYLKKKSFLMPYKGFENSSMWLPAKRRTRFGPYEYTTQDGKYGKILNPNYTIKYVDDFFHKNCLLFHPLMKSLVPEYCDKLYPHACIFHKNASDVKCPDNCVSAGLGSDQCYCKVFNASCSNYASINTPFDKNLLSDYAGFDVCQIDHRQIISREIWRELDTSVACSICMEVVKQRKKVKQKQIAKPVLSFLKDKHELYLTVYSSDDIFSINNKEGVYCFTNAADDKLNKTVNFKKVFESKSRKTLGITEDSVKVYKLELEKYMGLYNCQVHRKSNFSDVVHSNTVVAYKKNKGNGYALRMQISNACTVFNCGNLLNIRFEKFIHPNISKLFKSLEAVVRVMEIFDFDLNADTVDLLLHVTTKKRRDLIEEFSKYRKKLSEVNFAGIKIDYFRNVEYCLPSETFSGGHLLTWPLTAISESTLSSELCPIDGVPPYRICEGTFLYGAYWSDIIGECDFDRDISDVTLFLFNITKYNLTITGDLLRNVKNLIVGHNLTLPDVFYLGKFLEELHDSTEVISTDILQEFLDILDTILNISYKILKDAQTIFNSTDTILDLTDSILSKSSVDLNDNHLYSMNNFIAYITNPFVSNYSGISVYSNTSGGYYVQPIQRRVAFNDLANKQLLRLAFYIPEEIFDDISNKTNGEVGNVSLIITIFKRDTLFISEMDASSAPIISISIPGFGTYLINSIPIIFKSPSSDVPQPNCVFWDYGKNSQRHRGEWSKIGSKFIGHFAITSDLFICSYSHLTHFALVFDQSRSVLVKYGVKHSLILYIISYVCFSLTVFGMVGITATAIIFEKWRRKTGTKILINLSVAITLEAISVQLKDVEYLNSYGSCLIAGILLHYTLLSKFCWMLVYSYLQYLRFVKVLGPQPNNLILKSVLFGWGVGIAPVLAVSLSNSYRDDDKDMCIPTGLTFYLGLILPICTIIIINTIIFTRVMMEVWNKTVETNGHLNKYKLQLKLGVLLFFICGLPWIFGILAGLIPYYWLKMFFIYIFYITANLEQFILFLFYVVLNEETKNNWIDYFKSNKDL